MSTKRADSLGTVLAGVVIATVRLGGAYVASGDFYRLDLVIGVSGGILFAVIYYPIIRRMRNS